MDFPMGRFGSAEEIAALMVWVAGRECSVSTRVVFDARR
jgi:hypothetical protein